MRCLGISNDFTFGWGLTSVPPRAGWPRSDPGLPGPLAPAPLQGLHLYDKPARPLCSASVLCPSRFWPLGVLLLAGRVAQPAQPNGRVGIGTTGSPVPRQRLRRAHATYT